MGEAGSDATAAAAKPLECAIELEYSDRVNFAMQQNGVPLVDSIRITSRNAEAIDDLVIELALGNGDAAPWSGRLSRLAPDETASLSPTGFALRGAALASRTEAEVTEIVCRVVSGDRRAERSFAVDLLAFDQWPGVGHWPELTAAFVTPNHPEVARLLAAARHALRDTGASDALEGYQSKSRQRAVQIAEACFNAAAARGIGYISPPASFETSGQRVRVVDRLLREGLGTCLDLSLLLLSLWEQCGLHGMLLLPEGHAMPAVWTHDAHLPETAIDEPARVRNLIELGELVPVESTRLTAAPLDFADAVHAAKKRMQDPGASFCAIDIRSARKRGVRPLPLRHDGEHGVDLSSLEASAAETVSRAAIDRVALAERAEHRATGAAFDAGDEAGPDRIARWQTRLLDLSLRNRLLNYRPTGRTLALAVPDLAGLEDRLAEGDRFTIHPKAESSDAFLREQLGAGHVYAAESPAEVSKRLLTLYRTAKSSIEETGANVLHLALGMLKWYESESAEQPRHAPLVLLPIALTRTSTGSGYSYSFRLTDEPLRPNVTLLEKLRSEFGIDTSSLDGLPEDEHGLDVDLILRNFRAAIRASSRWEVVETASIGLFSFSKFLMWKDLKENLDRLRANRLVEHLVDRPGQDFDTTPFPMPEEFDARFGPDDLLCTREADSSQLAAVRAAAEGRTFVLEGPPGTGKSQTIANIIANSLASGQRVLFVAEKVAALSVVRTRLERDGLGPFCLEVHSAKASKKEVLAQLEEALTVGGTAAPPEWDALCAALGATREQLNSYVRELHKPRATGESLYRMLGRLSLLADGPQIAPPTPMPADTSAERLQEWVGLVGELRQRGSAVDPVGAFPLRGIGCSEWSFSLADEARLAIDAGIASLRELSHAAADFLRETMGEAEPARLSRDTIEAIARVAALLQSCPSPPIDLLRGPKATTLRARATEAIELGAGIDAERSELLRVYREEFLDVDHLVHADAIERHLRQPAILRLFTAGGLKKKLRIYASGELRPLEAVRDDLSRVGELRRMRTRLEQHSDIAALFGTQWAGGADDWSHRAEQVRWAEALSAALECVDRDEACGDAGAALAEVAASPGRASDIGPAAMRLVKAWNGWCDAWSDLAGRLETSFHDAVGESGSLASATATLDRWRSHLHELNTWVTWRAARAKAVDGDLGELVSLYERGGCGLEDLEAVFWRSFGTPWFNSIADRVDAIRSFNARSHADAVTRFRELDAMSIELTRRVVASRLAERAPAAPAEASSQSEIGILRRELAKKRRHLPTRRLIEAMPTLLPRLKPCFLMSPLSVAQYLDSGLPPFDLVVFDEASQIPVWDAIGAIARGTDVIVVGDSKQLPPTSFFSTIDGDDEFDADDHAVEDTESILMECNASGIPSLRLRWHYRSRHETLIAFSNHLYYENELHTFPSPEERSERLGVTFRHVADGVYDRGGSRTNRVEAERVVAEVTRMLRNPSSTDSIGVVTFNQAQQSLIEDLLDAERRQSPELEPAFTSEVAEPVFVKNLESVQGDERDTIIFSVGYGPDRSGRPSMNFGPLNKDGGERRLNVAVTRARRRLVVFSSLTSDQIDLKRTRAVGVRDFKTFLDYANRGPRAIAEAVHTDDGGPASGLEEAVRSVLVDHGWEVDMRVGCAGYRIDLAVRHPKRPGAYVLGIECDGPAYHSAKTARDRDRTRDAVLRGLGWRLARVWSIEWRVNPRGCTEQLLAAIDAALAAEDEPPAETDRPSSAELPASPANATVEPEAGDSPFASGSAGGVLAEPAAEAAVAQAPEQVAEPVYRLAEFGPDPLGSADVYDEAAGPTLVGMLRSIVATESPITAEFAKLRLARACGVQSLRQRFSDRFDEVLRAATRSGAVKRFGDDLWAPDHDPDRFVGYRVPGEHEDAQRDLDDVPTVEIRNAVLRVVSEQFGLPREELVREAARRFGVKRATARVAERIGEAIDMAVEQGRAQESEGRVTQPPA